MQIYFTNQQLLWLAGGLVMVLAAVLMWTRGKDFVALALLALGTLFCGFWVAGLDGFLCIWDEQFHALVAKHLVKEPLKPMLYDKPLLDYDFRDWTANHVWLHKQPLFLWLMALSVKFFGASAWAVRLPSVLMHAIGVLMVFRIGALAMNRNAGFYGAVFFGLSYHLLELGAGKFATDHNDSAFLFFVTGSLWSWMDYEARGRKWYWLVAVGMFAGCAVLVKWLVGLLVYGVWTIVQVATDVKNALKWGSYKAMLASVAVAVLIFVPWQVYVWWAFPAEARYEMGLNTEHFFRAVEGHGGDVWFHLRALRNIYGGGEAVPYLLALGGILVMWKSSSRVYKVGLSAAVLLTYGFYTLAATKMTSFCVIVAPLGFLFLGALAEQLLSALEKALKNRLVLQLITMLGVFAVAVLLLDVGKIERYHTIKYPHDNMNRADDMAQMQLIEQLKTELKGADWVVFDADVRLKGHIAVMFYTDCLAYDFVPSPDQVKRVKAAGYRVAVVNRGDLPEFLLKDKNVRVLEFISETI